MKTYEGKNIAACLQLAQKDTGMDIEVLKHSYHVISKKKTLFTSSIVISVFSEEDLAKFAYSYLDTILAFLGVKGTYTYTYDQKTKLITITISSDNGSQVIGKNGENLKSINTLVRSAVFNQYGGDYRILLDCDGYKEMKYAKIKSLALKMAKDVKRSHVPASLPPMPSDERRIVHEVLAGMTDIDDVSVGDGKKRHVVIKYVPGHIATAD